MDRDENEVLREALFEDNEDDLEFHMTFPSPTTRISSPKSDQDKGIGFDIL